MQPRVQLECGVVEGFAREGVATFLGVPYAAPPVGALRWRPPQPVSAWHGVRSAVDLAPDCTQRPTPGDAAPSRVSFSEDCLYLNVWVPDHIDPQPRPVVVWIHGGGFVNGGISPAIYDLSALAQQQLVAVSLNYRLGRLGYFAHSALSGAAEGPLGNYGWLDQVAALKWVQRNISRFGGDPGCVTIVGESAGGISVIQHLTAPFDQELFHRAAVLSGGGRSWLSGGRPLRGTSPSGLPSAESCGAEFAQRFGIFDRGPSAVEALRRLTADQVNGDLGLETMLALSTSFVGGPIVGGAGALDQPQQRFADGAFRRVPLLIGSTGDDLAIIYPPRPQEPWEWFGEDAARARQAYDLGPHASRAQIARRIAEDLTMHEPARFVARAMAEAGQPAWLYRFSYVAAALRSQLAAAPHASELPYLFGTLAARYGAAVAENDQDVSRRWLGYFVDFVRTGDPNGGGRPQWQPTTPDSLQLLQFETSGRIAWAIDPWQARLDLITAALSRSRMS